MHISAAVESGGTAHTARVETDGVPRDLLIPARSGRPGSSVNGGELLCAALATCFCNDLYREADRRKITLTRVQVEVHAEFGQRGEAAREITFSARVDGDASAEVLERLVAETDTVAEIQNTVRAGCAVRLVGTTVGGSA